MGLQFLVPLARHSAVRCKSFMFSSLPIRKGLDLGLGFWSILSTDSQSLLLVSFNYLFFITWKNGGVSPKDRAAEWGVSPKAEPRGMGCFTEADCAESLQPVENATYPLRRFAGFGGAKGPKSARRRHDGPLRAAMGRSANWSAVTDRSDSRYRRIQDQHAWTRRIVQTPPSQLDLLQFAQHVTAGSLERFGYHWPCQGAAQTGSTPVATRAAAEHGGQRCGS